jgi:predicted nucleotidyltransferase
MKKNELLAYISDFLSLLYFKEGFLDKTRYIILFGSVARGDFDKESDIDLFVDVKGKEDIKKLQGIVDSSLNEFELKAKDIWHIRNIKNPIKCIVGSLKDKRWALLKKEMGSYGILLYGAFKSEAEGLNSYSLFEYSLKSFNQRKRVAFQRELIGYKSKKKGKVYEHKGLIQKINGIKLENNNIIAATRDALELQKFFTKRKVTPLIRELWFSEKNA